MPAEQVAARLTAVRSQLQNDPSRFVPLCISGRDALPPPLPAIHRELQAFLSEHGRALIELPRDHGKSTQVCARLVWELGRNPALRIKERAHV